MMAMGARGVISAAANVIPEQMHALALNYLRGEITSCRRLQMALMPLLRALFSDVNPIPVKAALSMMGKAEDTLRLPLVPLDESKRANLKKQMECLKLI